MVIIIGTRFDGSVSSPKITPSFGYFLQCKMYYFPVALYCFKVSLNLNHDNQWLNQGSTKNALAVSVQFFSNFHAVFSKNLAKQECIPVGCVLSAAVAVCLGVCLPRGVSAWGCLPSGCLPRGVSAKGVSVWGMSAQGDVSQHALGQQLPCGQNDKHL